jgi:hypothetical protein
VPEQSSASGVLAGAGKIMHLQSRSPSGRSRQCLLADLTAHARAPCREYAAGSPLAAVA